MAISRFPCFECGAPFDEELPRDVHQREYGHGFAQVQLDAIDRARWGVMGDDAPPPESAYSGVKATVGRRRRATALRVIRGGKI